MTKITKPPLISIVNYFISHHKHLHHDIYSNCLYHTSLVFTHRLNERFGSNSKVTLIETLLDTIRRVQSLSTAVDQLCNSKYRIAQNFGRIKLWWGWNCKNVGRENFGGWQRQSLFNI